MGVKGDLETTVAEIVRQPWSIRDGQVVPQTTDIALKGGGVRLDATILYSDLANSTGLAMNFDKRVAAKVAKAFLSTCSRIIRDHSGEIRSFDGDRVMAAFVGDSKNSSAAKCALKINYCFVNLLKPKFEAAFPKLASEFTLAHCTGVDTSELLVVRGGIRDNNDLVWIGRAPNVAAKLSNFRNSPYHSYITGDVYKKLSEEAKLTGDKDMWEKRSWSNGPVEDIYRSSWTWEP
jgi:adenylate cyclase